MTAKAYILPHYGARTEYKIADVSIKYNICDSSATAEFYVRPDAEIVPFSWVELNFNGQSAYQGYVDRVIKEPGRGVRISCDSALLKAQRTWFKEEYISTGQSTTYWSNFFFNKAQIADYAVRNVAQTVPKDHAWGFMTAFEALKNLAQITNSKLYVDREGTVILSPIKESGVDKTITHYEKVDTAYSSEIIRTRAIVWGQECFAEETRSSPYVSETRTAAISTGLIQTESEARRLARAILDAFGEPLYLRSFVIDGDSSLSLNDFVSTPYGDGAITALEHSYTAEKFTSVVTIGHICPDFFGISTKEPALYLSGVQAGVWKSEDLGASWRNISGTPLLSKTVPAIHCDDVLLWAITANDIYKSADMEGTWTKCAKAATFTAGDTVYNTADFIFYDIITDLEAVYVVAQDTTHRQIVVLISTDEYNFNRLIVVE